MAQQSTSAAASLTVVGANNGAISTTEDRRSLYLKLFSGEMFKGFQNNTIARDLVMKRTLKNGRSLQFIYTGRTKAEFHKPGNSILGNGDSAPPVAEKTITCDDLLISSAFVYELDETLAHYELRGEISKKIGYALAEKYDRLIFRAIAKAARQKSPITKSDYIEPGGTQISLGGQANAAWDASSLVDGFYDAAAALDEKGVSNEGRVAVISPRQYYALIQNTNVTGDAGSATKANNYLSLAVNRDETGKAVQSGNGIYEIAGIRIYKSMNIPFMGNYGVKYDVEAGPTDPGATGSHVEAAIEHGESGTPGPTNGPNADSSAPYSQTVNNYGAATNFANSCGLIFQKEAAGVVEAIGPQVQVTSGDVSVVYQGDVILGRLAMGADYLNPACAVELLAGVAASRDGNGVANTSNNAGFTTANSGG